ncbi:deoxyribose-phosphate aldolase [uncultured Veillonella sp.]|uniref:deoxyribose-phosphate aldolase n=1 Tax=uncultured Veillonella sp. TaxID=159268 RepID=UPI00263900A6|nr:deoxyribose-phosphate aldolase [uncultured Veillonella sp.]
MKGSFTGRDILRHVDHTLLRPTATLSEVEALVEEAILYKTASVCIPPMFVKPVKAKYKQAISICTVIGFPLGYASMEAKIFETKQALLDGADEIDMVIPLGLVKAQEFDCIEQEIRQIKEVCANRILKVIVETCYLNETEKVKIAQVVTTGGADFIKTSTGFGTGGATVADVELLKQAVGPKVAVKAAGGLRTIEDLAAMLKAGATRLGASAAVGLLKDHLDEEF